MRTLQRNRRVCYYAKQKGREEIADAYGNATGEYTVAYGKPVRLNLNIGAEGGAWELAQYGISHPNTRTLVTDDMSCPIDELSVLWIDVPPSEPFNYVVTDIGRSLNSVKITVRRVDK